MIEIGEVVAQLLAQTDDPYVFGAEAAANDPDPDAWDCSELVEWACHRADVPMVDGSKNQRDFCARRGTLIPVRRAIDTFGALLFRMTGSPTHVAMSLGDGRTIEARGRDYGVGVFTAHNRAWTDGALIPGVLYTAGGAGTEVDPVKLDEAYAALKGGQNYIAQDLERRLNLIDAELDVVRGALATIANRLLNIEQKLDQRR